MADSASEQSRVYLSVALPQLVKLLLAA